VDIGGYTMFNKRSIALLVAAFSSLHTGVQAQDSTAVVLEEIIVTARKRAESVQEIPLSIVPFQAEQLLRRDIQSMEDLATNTIGLSYNQGVSSGVQGSASIRGLSTNFVQDRFQNVGIYLDGVYLQRQSMMNIGMVDLQRVEVVKGPQNALYGRNAFAGAINYVTQKPTEDFEAYVLATIGSDEREDYRGAISGTLMKDKVYGRLSYGQSEYDGANENPHPFDGVSVPGFHNRDNLGGWDDKTYSGGLLFTPTQDIEVGMTYYHTDIKREFQSSYFINGVQTVANFGTSQYDDMNFNQKTLQVQQGPVLQEFTGHTLYKGELPNKPGAGTYIGSGTPQPDQAIFGAVDPRAFGAKAETELVSVNFGWEIDGNWNLQYLFGYIDHDSETNGPAQRDILEGSTYNDVTQIIHTADFSSRPNSSMDTASHELRLEWTGSDRWSVSGGLYYAETDDESYDLTIFAPPCSDRDLNNSGSADDEIANCNLRVESGMPSPLDDASFLGILDFFNNNWNGSQSNRTKYDDTIYAVFAEASYNLTDEITIRVEGRYTEEDREINRLTDIFGLAPGETGYGEGIFGDVAIESSIVVPKDDKTFDYFTPRLSVDWAWSDENMVYAYVAKGVKSGGFNNSTSTADLIYDEEENWTYELGSKNVFFDNKLTLNGALFYVDWSDMQGSLSPTVQSQNSNVVIGNIGDATNAGIEVEGTWRFNNEWSIDLAYTWINPEYDDAEFDAAQRYYYYDCPVDVIPDEDPNNPGQPFLCGNTNIDGNQLQRTSEEMGLAAISYVDEWFGGWTLSARVDASYQSKQYINPLNVGYVGSRTLYNGSVNFTGPESHWDVTLWGKNLADDNYVQSTFSTALFNNSLVATGQGRSVGGTLKYNF
jgi:iron complex outermembrane receptor protein